MSRLIIVTGPDRCGKSTIVKKIDKFLTNSKKFNIHSGCPPELEYDVNKWSIQHYRQLIERFSNLVSIGFDVICDRFYEGEFVYGIKYRNQNEKSVFDLEDLLVANNVNVKLILMDDDIESIIARQDGLSIEKDRNEFLDVQRRFKHFFEQTKIQNKIVLNLNNYSDDELKQFLEI